MVRGLLRWSLVIICLLIAIFLISHLDKGIKLTDVEDRMYMYPLSTSTLQEALAPYPELQILNAEEHLVQVPKGQVKSLIREMREKNKLLLLSEPLPPVPSFDGSLYLTEVKRALEGVLAGNFGQITFANRQYPVTDYLSKMLERTASYLLPALGLALVAGYGLAVWAALRPRAGQVLDKVNAMFMSLPDFAIVVALQMLAIQYVKIFNEPGAILVRQFASNTPFLIPFLAIAILPTAMLFGTMSIAVQREFEEGYIKTARSKGLSHEAVVFGHVLRNTTEDLLTVLPRAVTAAISAMVVSEVMCGIFGLGGYAMAERVSGVTALATTCTLLAAVALFVHVMIALLRRFVVVNTKEGDA